MSNIKYQLFDLSTKEFLLPEKLYLEDGEIMGASPAEEVPPTSFVVVLTTGIVDKNNIELKECDIVRVQATTKARPQIYGEEFTGIVDFLNGSFGLRVEKDGYGITPPQSFISLFELLALDMYEFEIIGSDLLEV